MDAEPKRGRREHPARDFATFARLGPFAHKAGARGESAC